MPAPTKKPADGQQGEADGDEDPQGGDGGGTPPATGNPGSSKTFTQDQLDEMVERRLAQERRKFSDYDDLKRRVEEAEEGQKTELQKAIDKAAEADQRSENRIALADSRLRVAAIREQAATQGAVDTDLVLAALRDDDSITVDDDGNVKGADKAVEKLLEKKPILKKGSTPPTSGGEFGGNDGKTLPQRINEAKAKGDWREVTRLEMEKLRTR